MKYYFKHRWLDRHEGRSIDFRTKRDAKRAFHTWQNIALIRGLTLYAVASSGREETLATWGDQK